MRRALSGRRPSLANRGWRWPSRPPSLPISSAPSTGAPIASLARGLRRKPGTTVTPVAPDDEGGTSPLSRVAWSWAEGHHTVSGQDCHSGRPGSSGMPWVGLARIPARNGGVHLQYQWTRAPAPLGRPGDFTRAETGHLGFTRRVRLGRLDEPSAYSRWREANPAPHPNDPATVGAHSYFPRAEPPSICCGVASSSRPSRGLHQARRGTR